MGDTNSWVRCIHCLPSARKRHPLEMQRMQHAAADIRPVATELGIGLIVPLHHALLLHDCDICRADCESCGAHPEVITSYTSQDTYSTSANCRVNNAAEV